MKVLSVLASLNILLLFFLFGCGGGSGTADSLAEPPENPAPLQLASVPAFQLEDTGALLTQLEARLNGLNIEGFFEESYKALIERVPEDIIGDGALSFYPDLIVSLDDISDEFYFQSVELKQRVLTLLLTYDRSSLTKEQQLSFDIYRSYLEFEIEAADYKAFDFPASYGRFGWQGATEIFFTQVLQVTDKSSADNYLILLNQVGRRFSQIETLLDNRQSDGVVEPNYTLSYAKEIVDSIANTSAKSTSYYTAFSQMISPLTNISSDEKSTLLSLAELTINQRVRPAYSSLSNKIGSVLNSAPSQIGFGQYTGGDEFYNFRLGYYTSSDMSADEIHQLGISELEKIHTQIRALTEQLGYPQGETIAQLFSRIDSDAGTIEASRALQVYNDIIDVAYTKLPQVFAQLPQQKVVVVGGASGGYYISSSDDGARPGAFYANTVGPTVYTTMPTLAYHEAVPGHHLQIALAQELELPRFRRKINFTNFVEGWGLYAERLAGDLGWYENDIYGDLGRLQFEALRASRLVIDTGIHSKGWTVEQANEFSVANIGAQGSIARYSVWPGQATAYSTGMLKILELRERAKTQLGDRYDIREFHSELIGNGSMPMNILEQWIDEYIAEKLSQP